MKKRFWWMYLGFFCLFIGGALVVSSFLEGGTNTNLIVGLALGLSSFIWFALQTIIDLLFEINENTKK